METPQNKKSSLADRILKASALVGLAHICLKFAGLIQAKVATQYLDSSIYEPIMVVAFTGVINSLFLIGEEVIGPTFLTIFMKEKEQKDEKTAWDYTNVTRMVAHPIDENILTVKGGTFVTIANQAESRYLYHHRGFAVNRSNVRLEGVRHEVTGELDHGAPYDGFFSISHCAFVTVTNCTFTAHKTYTTIGSAGTKVSM